MLRIATYYESRLGRNDGNPLYVSAALKRIQYYGAIVSGNPTDESLRSWFNANAKDGGEDPLALQIAQELWDKYRETIEIDHIYPTGETKAFGTYDLNIHVDWGEDGLTSILPYTPMDTPSPSLYWASDTHIQIPPSDSYPYRLGMASRSDMVFCAQKRGLEQMRADGVPHALWLPHAVEPQAYIKTDVATKRWDVCFVGHINTANRAEALDRLFREFPNFYYGQDLFDGAAMKYSRSKICFNISMTDDINMRTFEVMGSGSMLLTNWIPTIEELFQDGKHLVLYRSEEEMIDKVKYYLAHDEERERIAQAGYEEAMAKHTINHRVKFMLETFLASRKLLVTA